MAKINNVGLNLSQKIANPFKTSRNSTTNPFKNNNFEGNTLLCADVFEGLESKKSGLSFKGKMISTSVIGSMSKIKSIIPESIVNFVKRVGTGLSGAWEYAKNTNVSDLAKAGINNVNNVMRTDIIDIGKGISNIGKGLSNKLVDSSDKVMKKIAFLNTDVTEIGRSISDKWTLLISKVPHHNKISKDTPVLELKAMWLEENAKALKEAS